MVRVYTGWRRYDTEEELKILGKLTRLVCLRNNLFIPQMKLIGRDREGGKEAYNIQTPLGRVPWA